MRTPTDNTRKKLKKAVSLLLTTNDPVGDVAIQSGFTPQTLSEILKYTAGDTPSEFRKKNNVHSISKAVQNRVTRTINFLLNTNDPITEEHARNLGYKSQAALSRDIKKYKNLSPQALRKNNHIRTIAEATQKRLVKAIVLLLTTTDSISDLANELGHNSRDIFANEVKRYTGVSPKRYRENKNVFQEKLKIRNALVQNDFSTSTMNIAIKKGYIGARILEQVFNELSPQAHQIGIDAYRGHLKFWRAQRLIRRTDLTVEQIAEQVGFQDIKKFKKFFNDNADTTPTLYKKKHENLKSLRGWGYYKASFN